MPARGRLLRVGGSDKRLQCPHTCNGYMTQICMCTVWHVSEGERGGGGGALYLGGSWWVVEGQTSGGSVQGVWG